MCLFSLYKSEWKNAPKSADKCFRSKSVRDSHSQNVNLYWIMNYLIWPFLFHRPLHFSRIDSSIGSLLSPVIWDWRRWNFLPFTHSQHHWEHKWFSQFFYSSYWYKNIFRYGSSMPLLKLIGSIVYVEGTQKSICWTDLINYLKCQSP